MMEFPVGHHYGDYQWGWWHHFTGTLFLEWAPVYKHQTKYAHTCSIPVFAQFYKVKYYFVWCCRIAKEGLSVSKRKI